MAYLAKGKARSWEIRESTTTDRGPRSRTLATFTELDADVVARALARAQGGLDPDELRREALRKGAPVAPEPTDRAARVLLAGLTRGKSLPPGLAALLAEALVNERPERSEAARMGAEWVDADPADRGAALYDLLLLADQLPAGRRSLSLVFPRLETGA